MTWINYTYVITEDVERTCYGVCVYCVRFQVQTGTMAGISYGDKVELSHVLHPGLRVRGSVSHSHPLNSVVVIEDKDSKIKLSRAIKDIYQVLHALKQWNCL